MNILIINNYYSPNMIGGAENSIKILAEGLTKTNNNVCVYTLDGITKNSIKAPEEINGVKVYRGYLRSAFNNWKKGKSTFVDMVSNRKNFIWNGTTKSNIERIIKDNKIQIIHTNNLMAMSYWSAWSAARNHKIPIIHTLRDYWLINPSCVIGNGNKLLALIHSSIFKQIANHYVSCVTAPSDTTLKLFLERGFFISCPRIKVVNAIEISEEKLLRSLEKKEKRNNSITKFMYVGLLSENKGVDFLIDTFEQTKIECFRLTICGSGTLQKKIEDVCKRDSRICYKGQLDRKELEKEYDDADVLIVPSFWEEPFGRILIEAAQYAVLTIGSNRGGIPEIISTLHCGETYEYDNHNALRNLMLKFSDREIIWENIKNLKTTLKEYSHEKQVKNFVKLYMQGGID